ncbi:MAG TPA: FKBP-type peptidyl-prolyl cis-trans isomerase [Hanamia sp.]
MKNIAIAMVVVASLFLFSCEKNSTQQGCQYTPSKIVAPMSEQIALQDSLTAHSIVAIKDTAGFFYTINQPGSVSGVNDLCTSVAVYYTGGFFNGHVFDSTTIGQPAVFQLVQVIVGWQKGIPLIKKGGDITLYIPPSLGYGNIPKLDNAGDTVIPANSNLIFHVNLLDVQ